MSLENYHWPQQFFGTSGVVEIQRTHIKFAFVLINLETVSLVSTYTYPKWTSTHSIDLSLWKDNFGVWSPDPGRLLLSYLVHLQKFLFWKSYWKTDLKQSILFSLCPVKGDGMRHLQSLWGQEFLLQVFSLVFFQFRWDLFKYQQRRTLRSKF